MTSSGGSWRVASRLARREVRRHPWRHLLVVAMIVVPVLAALGAFSAITTYQDVRERRDRFVFGDDDVLRLESDRLAVHGEPGDDLRSPDAARALGIPEGTPTEVSWTGADWFHGHRQRIDGIGPFLAGSQVIEASEGTNAASRFVVSSGRLPRDAEEILLTTELARAGDWSVGDDVTSARSDRTFRVVGIGELGYDIGQRAAAVTGLPDDYWTQPLVGIDGVDTGRLSWLGTSGSGYLSTVTGTQVMAARATDGHVRELLRSASFSGAERADDLDRRIGPSLTMVAAGVCAVVAVVASAAFAISSRRQLRSIGLLSTLGADPSTIRRAMVLQGAIPGLIAGISAVGLAVSGAALLNAAEVAERSTRVAGARLALSPTGSVVVVLLGVACGVAAAWQPARTASRIPTLAALAGRRPLGPVPARVPLGGLVLWALGAGALLVGFGAGRTGRLHQLEPFLIIGGVAALALGGVGLAPVAVALLDPLAGRVRGTWRMGMRGLARHRMQSAATVAAIGVVLAIPVGLLTTRNGLEDRDPPPDRICCTSTSTTATTVPSRPIEVLRNPQRATQVAISGPLRSAAATDAAGEVLDVLGPDATVLRSLPLVDGGGAWRKVAVIDEAAAGSVLEPWAAEAVRSGKAVAFDGGPATVSFTATGDTASFDVVGRGPDGPRSYLPVGASYLVGSRALDGVGAERPADAMVVLRSTPLSPDEYADLRALPGADDFDTARWRAVPTLQEVRNAVRAGQGAAPGREAIRLSIQNGHPNGPAEEPVDVRTERDEWATALLVAAAIALVLALLVLTITLSLRAVDGEADRRAALAAGVGPAALRHQRAFEGVVLSVLGAALAIPLGWIPVVAARLGAEDQRAWGEVLSLPGWQAIPILVAPAVAAAVLWTVVPATTAAVRTARHRDVPDDLVPRW